MKCLNWARTGRKHEHLLKNLIM